MAVDGVPHKVEAAMRYQLRIRAFKQCQETTDAFVSCAEGRIFSTVWACRQQLNSLNECTKKHTHEGVMNEVKKRWVEAGKPSNTDWDTLLNGVS